MSRTRDGRFKISTVAAVEALVQIHGYDRAVERTLSDIELFGTRGERTLLVLAQERLACLSAYEEALRAAEAATEAASGPPMHLTERAAKQQAERAKADEAIADAKEALEQGAGLSVPQTEALLAVAREGKSTYDAEREDVFAPVRSSGFAQAVEAISQRTLDLALHQAERIPTDVLVAEVKRRGYTVGQDLDSLDRQHHEQRGEPYPGDQAEAERTITENSAGEVTSVAWKQPSKTTEDYVALIHQARAERERTRWPECQRAESSGGISDVREAQQNAEAWSRAQHPTTSSTLPEPEPLTTEQRIDRLEHSLGQAITRIITLEGRI